LGAWAGVLLFALALGPLFSREIESLKELMGRALLQVANPTVPEAMNLLTDGLTHALVVLVVLGSGIMVVGVAGALAQGGFYLATKAVKPKFAKLNPISGVKRIFGPQALWEGVKMLVKSALVGILAYSGIKAVLPLIGGFVPIGAVLEIVSGTMTSLVRNIAIAALVMAAADYAFQRRKVGKQTRMTKEEVKQEHKQTEGDPMLKSAMRSRQLAASRNRMFADIPQADVVLVNPTHIAVALRYNPEKGAPIVIARGAGAIAAKIREKATESRVPLVRDVPLARALYSSCQVGQEIPKELFAAVAQVLAFVISRRTQGLAGGELGTPRLSDDALPKVSAADRRRSRLADRSDGDKSGRSKP
jgi:flagellar biosynthetic protein FlhB